MRMNTTKTFCHRGTIHHDKEERTRSRKESEIKREKKKESSSSFNCSLVNEYMKTLI